MEVVELPAEHAPRIAAAEAMGPIPLFHAYAATAELSAEAVAAGQQILEVLVTCSLPFTLLPPTWPGQSYQSKGRPFMMCFRNVARMWGM